MERTMTEGNLSRRYDTSNIANSLQEINSFRKETDTMMAEERDGVPVRCRGRSPRFHAGMDDFESNCTPKHARTRTFRFPDIFSDRVSFVAEVRCYCPAGNEGGSMSPVSATTQHPARDGWSMTSV